MRTKARIFVALGQPAMAIATYRQLNEAFLAMAGKRVLEAAEDDTWRETILQEGMITLDTHLEGARRCFLRVMAWPRPPFVDRVNILGVLSRHK